MIRSRHRLTSCRLAAILAFSFVLIGADDGRRLQFAELSSLPSEETDGVRLACLVDLQLRVLQLIDLLVEVAMVDLR